MSPPAATSMRPGAGLYYIYIYACVGVCVQTPCRLNEPKSKNGGPQMGYMLKILFITSVKKISNTIHYPMIYYWASWPFISSNHPGGNANLLFETMKRVPEDGNAFRLCSSCLTNVLLFVICRLWISLLSYGCGLFSNPHRYSYGIKPHVHTISHVDRTLPLWAACAVISMINRKATMIPFYLLTSKKIYIQDIIYIDI